jgi:hypothetical protein
MLFILTLLSTKSIYIIFKKSVLASKTSQHISMTTVNWLMLFKEIIAVYSENHAKPINTLCGHNSELSNVKVAGACSKHYALKRTFLKLHFCLQIKCLLYGPEISFIYSRIRVALKTL